MFHQISTIFLIILSFDQVFGQSCTSPGNCREYGCCKDVNEGQLPDWRDGINCTSQIPNRDYEVSLLSFLRPYYLTSCSCIKVVNLQINQYFNTYLVLKSMFLRIFYGACQIPYLLEKVSVYNIF